MSDFDCPWSLLRHTQSVSPNESSPVDRLTRVYRASGVPDTGHPYRSRLGSPQVWVSCLRSVDLGRGEVTVEHLLRCFGPGH